MMDMISIIVPVYNAERYLHRCIDSIRNQTYQNLDIILVDDGSSDSSLRICENYAKLDNRIRVFHKENGGQASARNYALDRATGNYIGFVDNDDWVLPTMYEKLLDLIKKNHADVARCDDFISDEDMKLCITPEIKVIEKEEYFYLIFQDIVGSHVTNRLFRRDVIGKHRFPHSRTIEDMRFMRLILPNIHREVHTSEKLYFYTIRYDSASYVYAKSYINSYERACEYQDRYLEARVKYPHMQDLLLYKATKFSCSSWVRILKKICKNIKEFKNVNQFLVAYKKEIMKVKNLNLPYKLFVLLLLDI